MSNANDITVKKRDTDMTKGSITKTLFVFALPLLLGNLFQQLYNMADTYVIGQTGINEAYAAVGSVAPIINILIGIFMGLSSGAGVIISQNYGAKNYDKVRSATHTAIILTAVLSVVFTIAGILMTPLFLNLMLRSQSDGDAVFPYAKSYLIIYFAGVTGLLFYNMGSGILRAIGDSKRPFYYLVVAAVINIVLDVVFVFCFDMGVEGVAYATIIAQGVSAILTVVTLFCTDTCVKVNFKHLKVDFDTLWQIFKIGTPAALQMALTSFSNLFVMSYIGNVNGDKTLSLSGWTTFSKVDQIIFLPIQSLALATTTFVGQNFGVNDIERAKKGTKIAWFMSTVTTVVMMIPIMIFAPFIASIFNGDIGVVEYSTAFLIYLTPFHVFCCVNQVYAAALRGAGNTKAPMIIMLVNFILVRQVYLFIVSNYVSNDLIPIGMSYPVGWFTCMISVIVYYKSVKFDKYSLINNKTAIESEIFENESEIDVEKAV